jgi:SSS family solute:Na+ symporter
MDNGVNEVQLAIVIALFALVTVLGFAAARWRRAKALDNLEEWGLGGRNFGSWITWFLLGGDLYTAYTFVAVPALVFGVGALGFFAVPYTIVLYPIALLAAIRVWSVAHVHGFVTPADFVRGRHGSSTLALAIAVTGIVATMPYIALQLVGIEAVLKAMGVTGHLPIILAFGVLAAYTYSSGLRAPALIAFVKDALIYLVVLVAIIVIPIQLGGFDAIFGAAEEKFASSEPVGDDPNTIVPLLFDSQFPSWFAGIAFGAIAIGALVPAAIMSIAAANLFTRNIYCEYLRRGATPAEEARVSKITSLVVKAGALLVILALDPQFSIDLQLIGGVLILQTLPALVLGLWRTLVHRWALLAGWIAGMTAGLLMLYNTANATTGKEHFGGPTFPLADLGIDTKLTVYTGLLALIVNLLVVVVGSALLRALKAPRGEDVTRPDDYEAEAGDPRVEPLPGTPEQERRSGGRFTREAEPQPRSPRAEQSPAAATRDRDGEPR